MSLVEKYVCPRSDTAVPSPGLSTGNSTPTLKPGRCASESCPPLEDVAAKTSGRNRPRCTSSRCGARRTPSRALWPSLDPSPPEGPPLCPTIKAGKEGRPDPDDARDRRDRRERASAEESRCSTARLGTARGKRGESNYLAAQVRRLVQHDEVGIVVENPLRQVEDRRRRQVDGSNTPILLNLFEAVGKVNGALPSEMVSRTKTDSRTHCSFPSSHFVHFDSTISSM